MRYLRAAIVVLTLVAMALTTTGCGSKDVAAKVNGEVIKTSDVDAQLEQVKKQYPQMFEGVDGDVRLEDFRRRLLGNLIDQVLVRQAAEKRGVKVTDADLDKKVEEIRKGFPDEKQFEAALSGAGMSVEKLRDTMKSQLLTQKLLEQITSEIKITDAEIKSYYEANQKRFTQSAALRISHILFNEDEKTKAEGVLKELKAGGDFAAAAKKNSRDSTSASKGGDLGWPATPLLQEIQDAASKLKKGEMRGSLVKSTFGWHILKLVETRAEKLQTLEESRAEIVQELTSQRQADTYQKFLDAERKTAVIEYVDPAFKALETTPTAK